jgi:alcohol dehydrogenase YqhD (iron-dependent ADH family)
LEAAGVSYVELGGVRPNPRLSLVKEGIEICRRENIDFILAVGGGSAIDSAKAIAVGIPYDGDVWDLYSGKAVAQKSAGVGVVLTIPAAGSESSDSSVITNEDGDIKRGLTTDVFIPKFAILNPELTMTLPTYQTACGLADMLAHVMERYFTNVPAVDLSDKLCEALMRSIVKNGPIAVREPQNYDVRAEVMWCGTLAHNNLAGMGRVGDWASHAMEHELSTGIYDMAHGGGLAIIFPAWMKYVYEHNVARFAQFAVNVFGAFYDFAAPERTALAGIERLEQFFASLGLPTRFTGLDLPDLEKNIPMMAQKASSRGPIGNFVKLSVVDIEKIYRSAL